MGTLSLIAFADKPMEGITKSPFSLISDDTKMVLNGSNRSFDGSLDGDEMCSNCSGPPYGLSNADIQFYIIMWTYVAPILFSLILIVGTTGNGLVVYVVIKNKQLQSVTNVFLLSLAIADLLFLIFCVPVTAYKYAAANWIFGDAMCKVTTYVQYVTAYVTIWTLVCVSLLRYMTIVMSASTAKHRTKTNAAKFVVCQWVICMILNIPVLLVYYVKNHEFHSYCGALKSAIAPMLLVFFSMGYAAPLIVICLTYCLIVLHLHQSNQGSTAAKEATRERNSRACRLVSIVILVFAVMWLPKQVQSLVIHFKGGLPQEPVYEFFRILWECMAFGNSCANPFIYTCASRDFRKYFKEAFTCTLRRARRDVHRIPLDETLTKTDYETEKTSLV